MRVTRDGKKVEYAQVMADWFHPDQVGEISEDLEKLGPERTFKLMELMLDMPEFCKHLLQLTRAYKSAQGNLRLEDVQQAMALLAVEATHDS